MSKELLNEVVETIQGGDVKIAMTKPEVGQIVPLFGYITSIISETDVHMTAQINHYIIAHIASTPERNRLMRSRALEPGVFIGQIVNTEPLTIQCTAVVFGSKKEEVAQ